MYGGGKKLSKSEEDKEDYYKPKRESNFYNNNYVEYKSNGNENLSLKEHLYKIKPYLRYMITDLQESDNMENSINNCN